MDRETEDIIFDRCQYTLIEVGPEHLLLSLILAGKGADRYMAESGAVRNEPLMALKLNFLARVV